MTFFEKIRRAPLFPLLPFGPLLLAAGTIAVEIVTLTKLRRLARTVDELTRANTIMPA